MFYSFQNYESEFDTVKRDPNQGLTLLQVPRMTVAQFWDHTYAATPVVMRNGRMVDVVAHNEQVMAHTGVRPPQPLDIRKEVDVVKLSNSRLVNHPRSRSKYKRTCL